MIGPGTTLALPAPVEVIEAAQSSLSSEAVRYLAFKRKRLTASSERSYRTALSEFITVYPAAVISDFEPPRGTALIEDFLTGSRCSSGASPTGQASTTSSNCSGRGSASAGSLAAKRCSESRLTTPPLAGPGAMSSARTVTAERPKTPSTVSGATPAGRTSVAGTARTHGRASAAGPLRRPDSAAQTAQLDETMRTVIPGLDGKAR